MKNGFSLVEILIVLVLLGFLSISTFTAVRSTIRNKETVDVRTEILQEGRAAFAIMERDFMLAYFSTPEEFVWAPLPPPPPDRPDPDWYPAVKPFVVTVFKGSNTDVFFTARSHRRSGTNAPENESHFITLQLSSQNLVRATSARAVSSKDRENADKFESEILLEGVSKFKLQYFDPKTEDWVDAWDTEKKEYEYRLPEAVRVDVEYTPQISSAPKSVKLEPVALRSEFNIPESLFKEWQAPK